MLRGCPLPRPQHREGDAAARKIHDEVERSLEPPAQTAGVMWAVGVAKDLEPGPVVPLDRLGDRVADAVLDCGRADDDPQRQPSASTRTWILWPFTFLPAS